LGDDDRVENRPALANAADGIDDLGEIAHPVLEEVADALGVVA
jgi:hypothetical protein